MTWYLVAIIVIGAVAMLVSKWLSNHYMNRILKQENADLQKEYDINKKRSNVMMRVMFAGFAIYVLIVMLTATIPYTDYLIYGMLVMVCGLTLSSGYYGYNMQRLVKTILNNKNTKQ
ncbi:MAG: hypothetical protein LBO06_00990 [Bacteroidales bacterium]|jgi:hypothetical protein|nr:hypothetical protein [Bacteroidales bacterium]